MLSSALRGKQWDCPRHFMLALLQEAQRRSLGRTLARPSRPCGAIPKRAARDLALRWELAALQVATVDRLALAVVALIPDQNLEAIKAAAIKGSTSSSAQTVIILAFKSMPQSKSRR